MTPTPKAENFVYGLLLPRLENMGFKLYLQARDSLAGQGIYSDKMEVKFINN